MKKLVSLFLALIMVLSVCSIAVAEEPTELHFITRRRGNAYEENQVKQMIEEKFNVKINWEVLPSEGYVDACSVILASGDYPDMMEVQFASSTVAATEIPLMAEDGILAPLNELLTAYAPNVLAEREDSKWLWIDGDRYAIPCRPSDVTEKFITIRQDWLDNLGLEMPDSIEEFTEVCRAFTEDDPDGDGVKDTYALGAALSSSYQQTLQVVMSFFGAYDDWMQQADGTWMPWRLSENTFAAMKYLRELYLAGYVDPEFATDTRDRYLEKKSLDTFGVEQWYLTQTGSTSAWWNTFTANVPHANVQPLPLFGAEGYEPMFACTIASPYNVATGGYQLLIFDDSENKEKCMEIVNYLASDEGSELVTFGPKGVTWDEDENGNYIALEVDDETRNQSGQELYYVVYWHDVFKRSSDKLVLDGLEAYSPYVKTAHDFPYVYEGDTKALESLLDTHIIKIITDASIDPDAQYQVMVDEFNKMGGEDYVAWYNELMNK